MCEKGQWTPIRSTALRFMNEYAYPLLPACKDLQIVGGLPKSALVISRNLKYRVSPRQKESAVNTMSSDHFSPGALDEKDGKLVQMGNKAGLRKDLLSRSELFLLLL